MPYKIEAWGLKSVLNELIASSITYYIKIIYSIVNRYIFIILIIGLVNVIMINFKLFMCF